MTFFSTNTVSQPTWGKKFLGALSAKFTRGVQLVQVGQMISALNQMSDDNLNAIGVQRSEIAQHAENLVFGPKSAN